MLWYLVSRRAFFLPRVLRAIVLSRFGITSSSSLFFRKFIVHLSSNSPNYPHASLLIYIVILFKSKSARRKQANNGVYISLLVALCPPFSVFLLAHVYIRSSRHPVCLPHLLQFLRSRSCLRSSDSVLPHLSRELAITSNLTIIAEAMTSSHA